MINWKGLGRDGKDNSPDIHLDELTKTQKTVRKADVQLEIQTGCLSDISQKIAQSLQMLPHTCQ
jgi:hypothetical protein